MATNRWGYDFSASISKATAASARNRNERNRAQQKLLTRFFRNIDAAARKEFRDEAQGVVDRLLGKAKAETPVRQGGSGGGLRAALAGRLPVSGKLVLQLGLLTAALRRRYFYGWILDQGRRAQTVIARRRRADGTISTYDMRIRAIDREKYNFVFGRRADLYREEVPRLRAVWRRVIARAKAGLS